MPALHHRTSAIAVGALSCLIGVVTVFGCSADGTEVDAVDPNDPSANTKLPGDSHPSGDGDEITPSDNGGGTKDAGAPAKVPNEGDPCATVNAIVTRPCGRCGKQQAICLVEDGGAGRLSAFGACESEVGTCLPGATQACGNCGTTKCTAACTWGTCTGQPAGSCAPGAFDLQSAGCPTADTYRQRTCKGDCTWNDFSLTCEAAPTVVDVAATAGGVTGTIITLKSDAVSPRMSGNCETGAIVNAVTSPTVYTEIHNPNARAVVANVYHTRASGGSILDTVLAAYDGTTPPGDDSARAACLRGVNDYGNAALTVDSNFASLDGSLAVPIPAGGSVTIYSAAYYTYNPSMPTQSTGKVRLNVKVVSLE